MNVRQQSQYFQPTIMTKIGLLLSLLIVCTVGFSQKTKLVEWSATKRLALKDFKIVVTDSLSDHCGLANYINLTGGPFFSLAKKDFNQSVSNLMSPTVSWIDTNYHVAGQIRFMQTVFDISEIYARLLRKALTEKNSNSSKARRLAQETYIPEFVVRKDKYEKETKGGTLLSKQLEWEQIIAKELEALKEFAKD
jgi:hypothetical protein